MTDQPSPEHVLLLISSDELLNLLARAHRGEGPDTILLEYYANAQELASTSDGTLAVEVGGRFASWPSCQCGDPVMRGWRTCAACWTQAEEPAP